MIKWRKFFYFSSHIFKIWCFRGDGSLQQMQNFSTISLQYLPQKTQGQCHMGCEYHCSRPNLNIIIVKELLKNHAKCKIVLFVCGQTCWLIGELLVCVTCTFHSECRNIVMEFSSVSHGKSWKSHGILQLLRCMNPGSITAAQPYTAVPQPYNAAAQPYIAAVQPYIAPYNNMPAMSARPTEPMGVFGQGGQLPFVLTEEQLLQQQQLLREKQEFDAWSPSQNSASARNNF